MTADAAGTVWCFLRKLYVVYSAWWKSIKGWSATAWKHIESTTTPFGCCSHDWHKAETDTRKNKDTFESIGWRIWKCTDVQTNVIFQFQVVSQWIFLTLPTRQEHFHTLVHSQSKMCKGHDTFGWTQKRTPGQECSQQDWQCKLHDTQKKSQKQRKTLKEITKKQHKTLRFSTALNQQSLSSSQKLNLNSCCVYCCCCRLHGSGSDSDDRSYGAVRVQPAQPAAGLRGELDGASSGSSPRSSTHGSPRTQRRLEFPPPRAMPRSHSHDFPSK